MLLFCLNVRLQVRFRISKKIVASTDTAKGTLMTVAKSRISKIRSLVIKRALSKRCSRQGLTLVEIMIALTMTLIVLGAMMSTFRYASQKMPVSYTHLSLPTKAKV